ncbi:poly(ADP-ribose) polymerase family member 14-related sequence 1 isoform X1 [Gadus macrocephalus]|uniref:poly(ADP-ribose) polymerase family member 14-related sequence 1 isoform X1 n=1 Tax=Gadus macrocephalus TaxID=80720 RepID=UPI0028CB1D54|nr:poly(ADP-ribose) polymerase family member 14-related sequence 1 isoform X1 [Gadus macrocephalus]
MDDDAYSYALVVELEENVPRLKNKLVKYFQSKKRSGGGECKIQYEERSRTAVLRFRREEDRARVVAQETHEIVLDEGRLNVTVHLPEESPGRPQLTTISNKEQSNPDGRAAEEETQVEAVSREEKTEEPALGSTSAVLENVPQDKGKEFMEMLVLNICKNFKSPLTTQPEFSLEMLSDTCSIVVTFSSAKENNEFITSCQTNRTFLNNKLAVRALEVTSQVKVEDVSNIKEDVLLLYFENGGWEVEQVTPDEEEQSAVILFKMATAVQGIIKKEHCIGKKWVKVFPFYDSLGTALYGKDRPTPKLPAAFSQSIYSPLLKYLHQNQEAAEMACSHLSALFCKVDLLPSSVSFSPLPALLEQKDVKAKDIKQWKQSVEQAFTQVLSRFKTLKLQPPLSAWEECEAQIREIVLDKTVEIIAEKAEGTLSVVGLVDDVTRLEPTLNDLLTRIEKRLLRENSSITQKFEISKVMFHLLCQDGLADQLKGFYPELEISFQDKIILNGFQQEVNSAVNLVFNRVIAVKRQKLELDKALFQFLKDKDEEELTKIVFTSNGIHAAVEKDATSLSIIAVSDNVLRKAEDQLKQVLTSKYIDTSDSYALKKPEWQNLVKCLEEGNNTTSKKIVITTSSDHQLERVTVVGYKDSVIPAFKEIKEHLHKYSQVFETHRVKSDTIVSYITTQSNTWYEKVKDKVEISFEKEAVNFRGPREDVMNCKSILVSMISKVCFEEYQLPQPGAKEFFQEEKDMYVSTLKKETGCLVQLVEASGQNDLLRSRPIHNLQTSDGIDIVVSKADLCSYPVDAVVINSNKSLKLHGGIGGAFVAAAGSCLQEECDKIQIQGGELKPGDSVITGAGGRLQCKKVIHVVGPQYDPSNHLKTVGQLRRAVKGSLELAEMSGCQSLAISAISANMEFPIDLCADTIIKVLKEHCEDQFGQNPLKKIHFVSLDDHAVQAFEKAVRDKFGNQGRIGSRQSVPDKQNNNSSKPLGIDVGMRIQLGNIEDAKTQVVVNVVGEELDLENGAVSKAILSAAGPKLQYLVNEQKKTGDIGDVIVTDGCKLKSNCVFHAVVPAWDKQGNALKIMRGIVADCLNKAEKHGLTSISFPAIGTGNLGFPKDRAASVMMEEVSKFYKQPRCLKTVVIVLYPKDQETIQVFTDAFNKQLQTTTNVPAPTKSKSSLFSKVTSASGLHEITIGHVRVQVVLGDITKEKTDVIVNSSNESFTLKSGVSKAILDAAGPTVENECNKLGGQPNTGMILTTPGNLMCKKILHLAGRSNPQDIKDTMKDALVLVEQNQYTSISFPALGTGKGNAQAGKVADAMLDAVVDMVSQSAPGSLKEVRIIIFQQAMMKDFISRMEKKAGSDKHNISLFGKLKGGISAFLGGGREAKPQKDYDFSSQDRKIEPAHFHICGSSQAEVNKAKTWIKDLISKEHINSSIKDRAILSLSDSDIRRIMDIQNTMNVSVQIEPNNACINIEGLTKYMFKANNEIQEILKKVRDEEEIKKILETVDWQYQLQGVQFQNFDDPSKFLLEQAHHNKQPYVDVDIQGRVHTVDVQNGTATDNQGNSIDIRRHDLLKDQDVVNLPKHWETMPSGTSCQSYTVLPKTPEYDEVLQLFKATVQRNVIKIERIQNRFLWKSLQLKKADMEARNGHKNNERQLFHGACSTSIQDINRYGFNRSYAGKNAAHFGNGTYFAVNANYSAQDTYSKPDAQGQKCVYLCRVLTGDFTTGTRGMVVPPTKPSSSLQYDSVVDHLNHIQMFVIFHDTHACPEYLITFN